MKSLILLAGLVLAATAEDCHMDMVFLLDSSESVTEIKFDDMKSIVRKMVGMRSGVGPNAAQVALVPFNDEARVALFLNGAANAQALETDIDNLAYSPGLTNTYDAFRKTYESVLTANKGMRSGSKRVVVLISDGAYTEGTEDPSSMSKKLRDEKSATVLAIGVEGLNGGNTGAFHRQLSEITGDSSKVFDANNYVESVKKTLDSLCHM